MNKYFATVPSEQTRAYALKSAEIRRSPALKHARANAVKLINEYHAGQDVKLIAKKYKITVRSAYRIIKGK